MGAATAPTTWFTGDFDDPWVVEIADSLPYDTVRFPVDHDPASTHDGSPPPAAVIIHRSILTHSDVVRISRYRELGDPPPRIILVSGAHVRHDDLVRCSRLIDLSVPEAAARDVLSIRLLPAYSPIGPIREDSVRLPISIVCESLEYRRALAETCLAAGFRSLPDAADEPAGPRPITIWDAPLLNPTWTKTAARLSKSSRVVALLAFPDRAIVRTARELGVAACLESPCERGDLIHVLDRISSSLAGVSMPHALPPKPQFASRRAGMESPEDSHGRRTRRKS